MKTKEYMLRSITELDRKRGQLSGNLNSLSIRLGVIRRTELLFLVFHNRARLG